MLDRLQLKPKSVRVVFHNTVYMGNCYASKSPSDGNFFWLLLVQWGHPPESRLLEFLKRPKKDGCGGGGLVGWMVIVVSLWKTYVRMASKI